MTSTLEITRTDAATRRSEIRSQIGRRTPTEIRDWAGRDADRTWALNVADGLARSGFLTLSDVTDDEFDTIIS